MSKVVVDTSVLIDHLRGDARAKEALEEIIAAGDELWASTVVRTEVLAGMRPDEEQATLALLAALRWQDVSTEIADRAGELARRYLKSHPGLDTVDYLIAATAQELSASVLTQNVNHFPMFVGLESAYG